MRRKPIVLGLILLASTLGAQTAKHTITHEDIWLMRRVGAPVASPDGKWAVVLVTVPAYDAKDQTADLWLLSIDGATPPRQLTQTKSPESGAAWSPDSQRIVFSSKREGDEADQLYILNVATSGEAERVTNLTLGARQPKWSPDGRLLLFVSDTYPGCLDEAANKRAAKERADRKYHARVYETYPIRYWNHWLDDKKAHVFVQEARAGAQAKDLFAGTKVASSPGFGALNTDEGEAIDAEWAPDSATVVFTAAVNRDAAAREPVHTQLFSVPASGGEPVNLTSDGRSYSQPQFSPDKQSLYCKTNEEPVDKVYEVQRIARFPWPFKASGRVVITEAFDRSVGRFAIPSGGNRVWFTAEDSGRERLFSISTSGSESREEKAEGYGCLTGLSAGGPALVADWDSAIHPPEVVAIKTEGGTARTLTGFTDEKVAALDLAPAEMFTFTTTRGKKINNLFVRPPAFDPAKKYPLFVVIHGGAANMARDAWSLRWNHALLAAPGYGVLWTDYTGSSGYGEKWGQDIQFDPLKGPAAEINEAADEALKRFTFLDPTRQAAGGASYGGHLSNWLEATTTRYKCIVSHAGEADLAMEWGTSDGNFHREVMGGTPPWGDSKVWREQSPLMQGGNQEKGIGFKTPILLTVGEMDFRVPMNNAMTFYAMQQRLQVPSKLIIFPEETHWIQRGENSRFWYHEVQAWLAKYL